VETGSWIQNVMEKSRESSSLREANESIFAQYSMEEYGIPRVGL